MRKGAVAALAVVVLLGAAAAFGVPVLEQHAAERIKAQVESDGTTQVDGVEVSLFERGVTFSNIRSSRAGKVSAQRWAMSGLFWPLRELLHGHTPLAGWHVGDPIQADRIVVTDLRVEEPSGHWRIETLVAEGLDLERYDGRIGPSPYFYPILGARVARALSLRRLRETDISFTPPDGARRFTISDISMANLAHGKFGDLAISGIEVAGSKPGAPAFRLDHVKVAGLDLDRPLAALSAPGWRLGMPMGRVDVDAASVTGFGGEALARYGISLAGISTSTSRQPGSVTRMQGRVEGFVLTPPKGLQGLQMRVMLTAMGLNELKLGLDCTGMEDRGKGELSVDRCALSSPDLAEVDFGFKFQGADSAFWEAADSGDLAGFYRSRIALGSARLVLADNSLLDRLFKAIALSSGQPEALARQAMAQQVRQYQPAGVLITEDMTKLLDTVARFVEKGGTLTVGLKPDPPFGLDKIGRLSTPGPDLIGLLGVTATLAPPG